METIMRATAAAQVVLLLIANAAVLWFRSLTVAVCVIAVLAIAILAFRFVMGWRRLRRASAAPRPARLGPGSSSLSMTPVRHG